MSAIHIRLEFNMGRPSKFNKEQLIEAVCNSTSLCQVMKILKVNYNGGGNYRTIQKYIKIYNIDTSHFAGQGWSKGKKVGPKVDIQEYLSNKRYIGSHSLKLKLLDAKIFDKKCCNCQITKWLNQPVPLELHHIDGNNENNNLDNIQILCPNCHALTDNYCAKNKKNNKEIKTNTTICNTIYLCECGNQKSNRSKLCKSCNDHRLKPECRKVVRPSKEELEKLVWEKPTLQIAKDFGVSDKAIEKWCKSYNISKPPRGYWAKNSAGKETRTLTPCGTSS